MCSPLLTFASSAFLLLETVSHYVSTGWPQMSLCSVTGCTTTSVLCSLDFLTIIYEISVILC